MCGICGIFESDNRPVDPFDIKQMCSLLVHRGPDYEGTFVSDNVALGSRRLKIIDLKGGNQPLTNEDGSLQLVFNGEIYNYVELRKELLSGGHHFTSKSDSETILHGYEQWGIGVLDKLIGVFAFAIWDSKRRELFLARDRLGVKPLYYNQTDDRFLFASEIKAILPLNESSRKIDFKSLYDSFTFEFVPTPRTMFKGIFKIPPGHFIKFHDSKASIHEYWDISFPRKGTTFPKYSTQEWSERFQSVLSRAVKDRLRADVPIGAFLSGGLDSSAVVALASKERSDPLNVFSLEVSSKNHPEINEIKYSSDVARKYLAIQHVLKWKQDNYELLEKILWHTEYPVWGNYSIPLFLLSKIARLKGFKVLLTGDGSDENLAGYPEFLKMKLLRASLGKSDWKKIARKLSQIYPHMKGREIKFFKRYRKNHEKYFKGTPFEYYIRQGFRGGMEPLFSSNLMDVIGDYNPYDQLRRYSDRLKDIHYLNQAIYMENKLILPNHWMVKVDKMCMANGVEARVPFLDHRVVEFLAKVPPGLKIREMTEKYLLRKAMEKYLPQSVLIRKKHGLHTPVMFDPSILTNTETAREMLAPSAARNYGIFNPKKIESIKRSKKIGNSSRLARVFAVHLFFNKFGLSL
ncbi:MAG: asparagine synthase (glutamine-hydrolyzing) [Deltaproteobacteria bacterium]|nr:asparagine synthase (glutamine-hydrolyzing) [Deltaproteobacteria bacterium]